LDETALRATLRVETVNRCWETQNRKADEKYLGLPVPEERMVKENFEV